MLIGFRITNLYKLAPVLYFQLRSVASVAAAAVVVDLVVVVAFVGVVGGGGGL